MGKYQIIPAQKTFSETYSCNYPLVDNALLDVNNLIFSVLNKKDIQRQQRNYENNNTR